MGPDTDARPSTTPITDGRCPTCRASVRPDTPWCTQCWTDLRPPPPPPSAPEPADGPAPSRGRHAAPLDVTSLPDRAEPATANRPDGTGRGWPCAACGAHNAVELDACAGCGLGFLAGLRADAEPLLVLPGVGDIGRLSRGQRLGLAGGVVLVVVLLTLLMGLLFG